MDSKKQRIELLAPKIAAGVSIALAIFKVSAGIKLSSTALMTSGFDSVFDALASSAGFFFLKLSHEPADEDHPYGHSRIASVMSLAQAMFLLGLAFVLAQSAAQKIHQPFNVGAAGGILKCGYCRKYCNGFTLHISHRGGEKNPIYCSFCRSYALLI